MIKILFKFIVYVLFTLYAIVIFLPKENLFFLAEKELSKYKVVVANERVEDKYLSFNIKDYEVYYDDIFFGLGSEITLNTFLFSNSLEIKNFRISKSFQKFIPQRIDKVLVNYEITNPIEIKIEGFGEFGEIKGFVNLVERRVFIELFASKAMKKKSSSILRQMRNNKGVYTYEYKF